MCWWLLVGVGLVYFLFILFELVAGWWLFGFGVVVLVCSLRFAWVLVLI